MKKIKLLILALLAFSFTNVNAATIDNINAIDSKNIEVMANMETVFSATEVSGDLKILKDINVSFSSKDEIDNKKVVLNLSDDLEINTSYSLITILGADGSIDFKIGDILEGEIENELASGHEDGISKVNIIDSRTIELYFNSELTENIFEFKILSDIIISKLSSTGNNILNIETDSDLENNTDYILMLLTLEDINGNELVFEEDLYDFSTSVNLVEKVEEPKEEVNNQEVEKVEEPNEEIELNSAEEKKGNIEKVAMNTEETPDTGAETWVLVALTALVNVGLFMRRKFKK